DEPGRGALGNRVDRDAAHVLVRGERLERLGVAALVGVVARDRLAHLVEVFLEHRFLRFVDAAEVARQGEREEQRHDRHHHQQFNQGETGEKTRSRPDFGCFYHSLYGRPLIPTPLAREKTSKTSSPSFGSSGGLW